MNTIARGTRLPGAIPLREGVSIEPGLVWLVLVMMSDPSHDEVAAVERGALKIAVDREGPSLVWLIEVPGALDVSAAACAWWMRRAQEMPVDRPGVGGLAQVALVDARTAVVRAMRTVGLTLAVSSRLRELETDAQGVGRDEEGWQRTHRWTLEADLDALVARAKIASVVTGVPARPHR